MAEDQIPEATSPGGHQQKHTNIWLKTTAVYSTFISIGLCVSVFGPSLYDLEVLLDTDTNEISTSFFTAGFGYLIGGLSMGAVYNRANVLLLFTMAPLVMSAATIGAPWMINVTGFMVAKAIQNFSMGFIDAGSQPYLLQTLENSPFKDPIFQGVHFAFGVGTTIGPLLVQPFLSTSTDSISDVTEAKSTSLQLDNFTIDSNSSRNISSNKNINIQYGYLSVGCLVLITSLFYFSAFILEGPTCKHKNISFTENSSKSPLRKVRKVPFLFLCILYMSMWFLKLGAQLSVGKLLAIYVAKGLQEGTVTGAQVSSVFWGCICVGRLLGIPLTCYISHTNLLSFGLTLSIISLAVLLAFISSHPIALWICIALFGLGSATFPATLVLWMSNQVNFTKNMGTITLVGTMAGVMALPKLSGYFFQAYTHHWLIYITFYANALCLHVFFFMLIFADNWLHEKNPIIMTFPLAFRKK